VRRSQGRPEFWYITVLLATLFVLVDGYSPMHSKKQGLENQFAHSLNTCYGLNKNEFYDFSPASSKIYTGFTSEENVTVIVQFCYAVWTAYGTSQYYTGSSANAHKMGHTLGYYRSTWGSTKDESVVSDMATQTRLVSKEDFVATYDQGDRGAPCDLSPRATTIHIRCLERFDTCPEFANIASNCTQKEIDKQGGCICSFDHVTSCVSEVFMLLKCGKGLTKQDYDAFATGNVIPALVLVVFFYCIISIAKDFSGKSSKTAINMIYEDEYNLAYMFNYMLSKCMHVRDRIRGTALVSTHE